MIIDRPGRLAVVFALLGLGVLPATDRSAWARAPRPVAGEPAKDRPVPAYDRPLPASARLRTVGLTVLDDQTGSPIADAEVRIRNHLDWLTHEFRTDRRGQLLFEYAFLDEQPEASVEIRKDGFVPFLYAWGSEGGPEPREALSLRLRRGTTMGGTVVAAADRPVEGVTVLMSVTRYGSGTRADRWTGYEHFGGIALRTGPDGRWRSDSVPPGVQAVELRLFHPDFVCDESSTTGRTARSPKVAALRDQSDRQVLLRGLRIEGRVRDEQGRPIAGARIDDSTGRFGPFENDWCYRTDVDGRFHIHLGRGRNRFWAAAARGYASAVLQVAADPDRPLVEFRLSPGRRLRGRAVGPDGRPIEDAQVWVVSAPVPTSEPLRWRTDAWGRFGWDEAPAGPLTIRVEHEGYVAEMFTVTAGDREAVITPRPAVDLCIAVLDSRTGEAIPRFRVRVGTREPGTDETRWNLRTGRTAPRKFEVVLDAAKGPYHVEISADGYVAREIVFPAEQTVLRETIKLEKADP